MPKKAPLTLHGVDSPSSLTAANVAIDTLERFVRRWITDKRALAGLKIPIQDVWQSITDKVVRDAGIAAQGGRARVTVADLVVHADNLADDLKSICRGTRPEGSSGAAAARLHQERFKLAVEAKGSQAAIIWSFTARFFVSLLPEVLETLAEQHVSATKAFFRRENVPALPVARLQEVEEEIVVVPDEEEPVEASVAPPIRERVVEPVPQPAPVAYQFEEAPQEPVAIAIVTPPERPDGPLPAPTDADLEELIAQAQQGSVTTGTPPPFPMDHFNQHDFTFIMGVKQGPLVRLGIRTDAKVDMLTQLKLFNEESSAGARRAALQALAGHCTRYIDDNQGNAVRKAGRLEYIGALRAAAQWELDERNQLSARQKDADKWEICPKKFSAASGILSGLMAIDENAGRIEELLSQSQEPAQATQSAENLAGVAQQLSSEAGKQKLDSLGDALKTILSNVSLDNLHKAAGYYFDFLDFFDCSGIGKLLNAYQAFRDHARTKKRIEALEKRKGSRDWFVREFVGYAGGKLARRQLSNIFLGVTNFVGGLSRLITLLSGGVTAMVTEVLNLSTAIAGAVHEAIRDLKGIYKYVLGTRGVARKTRAALLIWRASLDAQGNGAPDLGLLSRIWEGRVAVDAQEAIALGGYLMELTSCLTNARKAAELKARFGMGQPTDALLLFKEFLEPEFVVGMALIKAIKKAAWEKLWGSGHEAVRILLALAIGLVKSDTSVMEVLRTASTKPREELAQFALAARISLWVQSLVFDALSSRPKYGASSWLGNRRDDFIQQLLTG